MRKIAKYILLVALLVGAGTWTATRGQTGNWPGCLDSSFGAGGVATAPTLAGVFDHIAVQRFANGEERVVALKAQTEWTIARFLGDGRFDTTFGTSGVVKRTSKFGTVYARGIVAQPDDNKLVVVGLVPTSSNTMPLAVSRYMPNGQYDASFGDVGNPGTTFLPYLSMTLPGGNMVLQSDGKILVTGHVFRDTNIYDTQVIRLDIDGALDTGFGSGGVATIASAGMSNALALQFVPNDDGELEERIVVATAVPHGPGLFSASLLRLTPGGSLDTTFGDSGVATIAIPEAQGTSLDHLTIDGSSRIVAVGSFRRSAATERDILAVRYLNDGTPDLGFADSGTLRQDSLVGHHALHSVAVHPTNGTILATGYTHASTYTLTIWRFTDRGDPDPSFDLDGMVTTGMRVGSYGGLAFVGGASRFVVGFGTSVGAKGRLKLTPAVGRFLY